ncbi:trypsin-3-like [Bacillus rossius redtenbacheri]|uniref:trypsin-3-like n=1 Tax=Bacillus rossius redtenbacheri TaxID=93214 RepID=UPI002FDD952D
MFRPVIFFALLACGLASESIFFNKLNPKIIGGSPAAIEEFPYMVSLQVDFLGIIRLHLCGGSIISQEWVVSAAHCTVNYGPSSLVIRAGSAREASGGQVRSVSQIIEHPNYNQGIPLDNDIVVIKVSSPFVYGVAVHPVVLPTANAAVASGTYGVITGWGATSQGGSGSATLLQVSVPLMTNNQCTQYYASNRISNGMICAGYQAGGKDSCQGDSGGPLAVEGVLVGIVSWGAGCAQPNAPGVYARVAFYRQWISSNTGI